MKLPSPKIQCSAEAINSRPVGILEPDSSWKRVIEPITKFKECLDRVRYCQDQGDNEVSRDDLAWINRYGLTAEELRGITVDPNTFSRWIIGTLREAGDGAQQDYQLVRIPSWSAIGWWRKGYHAVDEQAAQACRDQLDRATAEGKESMGYWLSPLLLVICGEGKNRTELHTRFFADMLINLRIEDLSAITELRLRYVLGTSQLLALQHRRPGGRWVTSLLPFPELSRPLFAALGGHVPRGWWIAWPWRRLVCQIAQDTRGSSLKASPLRLFLSPSRLRSALLRT